MVLEAGPCPAHRLTKEPLYRGTAHYRVLVSRYKCTATTGNSRSLCCGMQWRMDTEIGRIQEQKRDVDLHT